MTMKTTRTAKAIIYSVVFVAGVAAGFAVNTAMAPKVAEPGAKSVASDDADKLAKAQKRIAELERQLAAVKVPKKDDAKAERPKEGNQPELGDVKKIVVKSGDDIMDKLKENLSEDDFNAATNAMASIRAKLADKAKGKIEFLKSVDVSHMSESEIDNHLKFIELAEKREAAMAKMKGGFPDMSALQEVAALGIQMTPVAKKERSALVREAARELGFAGDDVEVVHDAMQNIYDVTAPGGIEGLMDAANEVSSPDVGVKVKANVITL